MKRLLLLTIIGVLVSSVLLSGTLKKPDKISAQYTHFCDFNSDYKVDDTDLGILKTNIFVPGDQPFTRGDCNGDKKVDGMDYVMWLNDFGKTQVSPQPEQPTGPVYYVSPSGSSSNDGSKSKPWNLTYALNNNPKVTAGVTVYLLEGTYNGSFDVNLKGTADKPITIKAYPGARAIVTNNLSKRIINIQNVSYVNFQNLEITTTNNNREYPGGSSTEYGVLVDKGRSSNNVKFINCVVHDTFGQGFGFWHTCRDCEIYGSMIFNNGRTTLDHGIYTQNETGTKRIVDNIIFDNAGFGIHGYSENADRHINNYHVEGNTIFSNGSIGYSINKDIYGYYKSSMIFGDKYLPTNNVIHSNYSYYPAGVGGGSIRLGYFGGGTKNTTLTDNYLINGTINFDGSQSGIKFSGNTIYNASLTGVSKSSYSDNNWASSIPDASFVRVNKYDNRRANLTVFNPSGKTTVSIPASKLANLNIKAGDTYRLRSVQDYFNDITTAVYDGNSIVLPMTGHSVRTPTDSPIKAKTTFPAFGAFLLEVNGSGTAENIAPIIEEQETTMLNKVASYITNLSIKDKISDVLGLSTSADAADIIVALDPTNVSYTTDFSANLTIDAKGKRPGFLRINLKFDPSKLQLAEAPSKSSFYGNYFSTSDIVTANTTGQLQIIAGLNVANKTTSPLSKFTLATLKFKNKVVGVNPGSSSILVDDPTVQAVGLNEVIYNHYPYNLLATSTVSVPTPTPTPTATPTSGPTTNPTPKPTPITSPTTGNLILNSSFENSRSYWNFGYSGEAYFTPGTAAAHTGKYGANMAFPNASGSLQLYQSDIRLEPNSKYVLTFYVRGNGVSKMAVSLIKHASPFTNYGLSREFAINSFSTWQKHTMEFTTKGFSSRVDDRRLRFWFTDYVTDGDRIHIDDVELRKL